MDTLKIILLSIAVVLFAFWCFIFLVTACTCEGNPRPSGKPCSKSTNENSSQRLYWQSGTFVCNGTLAVKSSGYYLVYNFICEDGRTIVNLVNATVK